MNLNSDWENSCLCLEDGMKPAAANLINLQSIYSDCLEGELMVNEIEVKYCECGCGTAIPTRNKYGKKLRYVFGHANKGKTPSDETIKKISMRKKGTLTGSENPMYGVKRPDVAKRNRESIGKKLTEEHKRKIHPGGRKHTEQTKIKMSKNNCMHNPEIVSKLSGDNCYMWKGGVSFEPYCTEFNNTIKEKVRDEFDRMCFLCGKIEDKQKHCVHHVDYHKEQGCDGREWKLVPLCRSCHAKTNFNREHWEQVFNDKFAQLQELTNT